MGFRLSSLISGENFLTSSFVYRGYREGHTIADMLAPEFFQAQSRLEVGDIGYLVGEDGTAHAVVSGIDLKGQPVISLIQACCGCSCDNPKRGRPRKAVEE